MNYSVLMSLYIKENPTYLEESIESILNQTLKSNEIVIVIDGPLTDELEEVLSKYKNKYPSLFIFPRLEKNVGLGPALNFGLEHCSNNIVARMDTDDIALPKRCEMQINRLKEKKELVMIGTNVDEFSEDINNTKKSRNVPSNYKDIVAFSKRRSPFNHPTVMYKKDKILALGGYHDVLRKEDYDLFVRMLNNDYYCENLEESLLFFRANEEAYKRRTSFNNCYNYTKLVYNFWKKGYSSFSDFMFVATMQLGMFLLPYKLVSYMTQKHLRN